MIMAPCRACLWLELHRLEPWFVSLLDEQKQKKETDSWFTKYGQKWLLVFELG
jgi:hypothetical protein